jgi:hypothetical protein
MPRNSATFATMKALALSVVWTIPLVFFQWLGMPWYWALFATLPVMAAAYLFYYRWVDRHG